MSAFSPTLNQRRRQGLAAVRAGSGSVRVVAESIPETVDLREPIIDALTNIAHFCDTLGIDFEAVCGTAALHHGEEVKP